MIVSIGFTGTQVGMTKRQKDLVLNYLGNRVHGHIVVFHHGDCVGADEQAHRIAMDLGCSVVIHPPIDEKKRAHCIGHEVRESKEYLVRNHDIVNETTALLVAPKTAVEELRSGTWATYRYAIKQRKEVKLFLP